MINAIRFGRTPPPIVLTSPLPPQLRRICSPELRSRQAIGLATAPDQNSNDMDDSQNKAKETGDIMCDSFGEAYATRSEEEGFGGTYGRNQPSDDETDNKKWPSHGNQHEYDKSQGCEVKEKEKSRHQAHAN
ncbi:uncharacterized protein LOC120074572 [Benincasa hispida]|uniref:uncharacterized protein LOC120074572 n=1 Tax=Benincasa hispida TaxID=102211 RepID=UPI0019027F20|nr:uncharacterized protein LOC120074572 [Benincasa hispida]